MTTTDLPGVPPDVDPDQPERGERPAAAPHFDGRRGRWVGASIPRHEDPRLLTGRGRFIDDIALSGMLHAGFVRATVAHAAITELDLTATREVHGVVAAYDAADLALGDIVAVLDRPAEEFTPTAMPILARGKVRFVGEPLALVVARDPYAVEDGIEAARGLLRRVRRRRLGGDGARPRCTRRARRGPRQRPARRRDVRHPGGGRGVRGRRPHRRRHHPQRPAERAPAGDAGRRRVVGRPGRPAARADLLAGAPPGPHDARALAADRGTDGARDRAGHGRRVRAEVRRGARGDRRRGRRASSRPPRQVDRGPARGAHRRLPGARAALPHACGVRRRRADHRARRRRRLRHGRLLLLPLHRGHRAADGLGGDAERVPGARLPGPGPRDHQQQGAHRALPRGEPPAVRHGDRARDGARGARAGPGPGRGPPSQRHHGVPVHGCQRRHLRPRHLPRVARPRRGDDPGRGLVRGAGGGRSEGRPASRHRLLLLLRAHRLRVRGVREAEDDRRPRVRPLRDPHGHHRLGGRHQRHDEPRAVARDDVRADRRRPARARRRRASSCARATPSASPTAGARSPRAR